MLVNIRLYLIYSLSRLYRGQKRVKARLFIDREQAFRIFSVQVSLGYYNYGIDSVMLGYCDKLINRFGNGSWLCGGKDRKYVIEICYRRISEFFL